jgi:cation:H+ antiporter
MDYLLLILGFVTLIIGGEFLVKGAVALAIKANVSTLVIGMTVVSFGTSAPELLVSVGAALSEGSDKMMSVGNIIGSNIANLALVLGITALIFPIPVQRVSIRQDWPVLMVSSVLFVVFMAFFDDDKFIVNRWEGLLLLMSIIAFTYYLIKKSREDSKKAKLEEENVKKEDESEKPVWQNISFLIIGCVGLVVGANWLLSAAVNIAETFEVPSFIIGVTVLAFGTSVPELVTSAIAAYRKQTDIAIGNLIGSNVFNILCVVGVTGSVAGMPLPESVLKFDIWWMLGITALILPLMAFGKKIHKWKGALLIVIYFSYIFFLIYDT